MVRALSPQTLSESDRRLVAAWAADCAARVLPLFEKDTPGDDRPRDAIARARAFGRGELTAAEEIRRRLVAGRAAHSVTDPAAIAAARAAAQAAGVAHMGAHALGAAAYAANAVALAHPERPDARDTEIRWQLAHLAPAAAAALRGLPRLGADPSGPLGRGLLASGVLGAIIREIQTRLASDPPDPDPPGTTAPVDPVDPADPVDPVDPVDPADLVLAEHHRRALIVWATACAERLFPIFDRERPNDRRLLDARTGADRFARGELGVGALRTLALACHGAARDAASPEATAVARVMGHATATAHMAAHAREIARYTRAAVTGDRREEELAWQRAHLPPGYAAYVYPEQRLSASAIRDSGSPRPPG